jgi:hypothetical protein
MMVMMMLKPRWERQTISYYLLDVNDDEYDIDVDDIVNVCMCGGCRSEFFVLMGAFSLLFAVRTFVSFRFSFPTTKQNRREKPAFFVEGGLLRHQKHIYKSGHDMINQRTLSIYLVKFENSVWRTISS